MNEKAEQFGSLLYEAFWKRNRWDNPKPFAEQAKAIRDMWTNIARDALDIVSGKPL